MPGLFGYADRAADAARLDHVYERMARALGVHRPLQRLVRASLRCPPFLLACDELRPSAALSGTARSGCQSAAFFGLLLEPSPSPDCAELLARHSSTGMDLVRGMRGYFLFAVGDSATGELDLYTDHAATHTLYYALHEGALYFSSDWHALAAVLSPPDEVHPHAVADLLTFGYMTGDKTPWSSIRCVPAGSRLRWNVHTGLMQVEPYFVADNTPEVAAGYVEMREGMQERFVQAVRRLLRIPRPLFTLSGGLDSRAFLGAARELGLARPDCLIFGELASLDVQLAMRVAHTIRAQTIVVSLGNGDYLLDTFAPACRYNGGMVFYNGSAHVLHTLRQLAIEQWAVLHTGASGDMLMGGFLHAGEISEPARDIPAVSSRVIAQLGYLGWIDRLVDDREAAQRLVTESVQGSLAAIRWRSDLSMSQALEQWNLYNRQQRGMFNGFRVIENYAAYSSPFFDADLYQYVLRIPHRWRMGEGMYVDMLSHLLPPELWHIPWQKTGRPPSRSGVVNKVNAWLTLWLGRAAQVVFPEVARLRSMNPFWAWLRDNASLRRFAAERLLAWETIPYPLSPGRVRRLAQEVLAGRVDRHLPNLLFRLLTLTSWRTGQWDD